jgi:predicted transcriptional regulator
MTGAALAHLAALNHPSAIRVYAWLTTTLDPLEFRPISLHRIAHHLHMNRGNVCRALALLRRMGFLARAGRAWPRGPYLYRLVPNPTVPVATTKQAA